MNKQLLSILFFFTTLIAGGQELPATSPNDIGELPPLSPVEIQKAEDYKQVFIEKYIKEYYENQNTRTSSPCSTYIIPVVFHVYGAQNPIGTVMQNGSPVNLAVIQSALDETNKDFNGLNSDFGTVHNSFKSRRGILSIEFRLAQKDTNGNPTTGVVFHPNDASYAPDNSSNTIPAVVADAWNNYMYLNIYVQKDWEGAGSTNLSGISWGPSEAMSNAKMARICYNGRYLGSNCGLASNGSNMDFTGVFTHELGHFFDLKHLFKDNLCYDAKIADNDGVPDTPNDFQGEGCHGSENATVPNCPFTPGNGMPQGSSSSNSLCNAENYMNYNNCHKMFTVGQVARMVTALNHAARKTLWQKSNLIATGVYCDSNTAISERQNDISFLEYYPNPSNGEFTLTIYSTARTYKIEICDILGKEVHTQFIENNSGKTSTHISLKNKLPGFYFITVSSDNCKRSIKMLVQ